MIPNQRSTQKTGIHGEDIAVQYLEREGYTILERRYHFEKAEVDIIAYDNRRIILVEVKTRTGTSFEDADGIMSVDQFRRIAHAGQAWLYERKMEGSPIRFDLIMVLIGTGEPLVKHYVDAGYDLQWKR